MKTWGRIAGFLVLFLFVASAAVLTARDPNVPATPFMRQVDPPGGGAGDILTATGDSLDKASVREVYLTDGKLDIKVEVVEQKAEVIRFKVPAEAKAGRYSLMVLTPTDPPKFIVQPVFVMVR